MAGLHPQAGKARGQDRTVLHPQAGKARRQDKGCSSSSSNRRF
jgi:hypothetical protein